MTTVGQLVLSGNNSFTGDLSISGGTIVSTGGTHLSGFSGALTRTVTGFVVDFFLGAADGNSQLSRDMVGFLQVPFIAGIANVLDALDTDKYRPTLKKKGFLTRDSRIRERRVVGMGGKSRRKKQSPKR